MTPRLLRWVHLLFVLGATGVALATAFRQPARPLGDAPEYLLLTESLTRHASPDLRQEDLKAVTDLSLRQGIAFPPGGTVIGYYEGDDGRQYGYHFWGYSLACVPAKLLLRFVGVNELKALQVTNALLMGLALAAVAFLAPLTETQRFLWNALSFLSPVAWFILWPHPEVFSFSLLTIGLVFSLRGQGHRAIAFASLAALQNPQLMLVAALFWAESVLHLRARLGAHVIFVMRARVAEGFHYALAAAPFLAHPLFYYWHFGTWSIVAQEATSLAKVSLARAVGLLFDLNLGLFPYIPVAVLVCLVFVLLDLARRRFSRGVRLFAALAALLLVSTLQWNYNHGSSGPSRYVIWMLPLVFLILVDGAVGWRRTFWVALAAVVSGAILVSRGGLIPRYDYLEHSPQARSVLDHFPRLYDPDYEVFIKRTLHAEGRPTRGPYVYRLNGACQKVLANQDNRGEVLAECGTIPQGAEAFFAQRPARKGRPKAWTYINY
jgi:hypothetical protein